MKFFTRHKLVFVLVFLIPILVGGFALVLADHDPDILHVCINNRGNIVVVANSTSCKSNETANTLVTEPALSNLIGPRSAFFAAAVDDAYQQIPNNTFTKITFGDEHFDVLGDFSNSRFTAPSDGIYDFTGYVVWGTNASNFRYTVRVYKNGSPYAIDIIDTKVLGNDGTDSKEGTAFSFLMDLEKDDYVELYVKQYTGSSQNLGNWSYFGGHKTQ